MVGSSPKVIPPRSDSASRSLAYEQAIARAPKPAAEESKPTEPAIPPFKTETAPEQQSPAEEVTATTPPAEQDQPDVMAAVPQEPSEAPQDIPPLPGESGDPYADMPPLPGEQRDAYGDTPPIQGKPWDGTEPPGADPWGQQEAGTYPAEQSEEWVQVVISGAAMRASASEDASMLFAFPYGRNLRVVSRYEGWLEVTDPQSSATGWMQTHHLAPTGSARPGYGQDQTAYEEPRERRGLFRRGGFADMIQRAFGGN